MAEKLGRTVQSMSLVRAEISRFLSSHLLFLCLSVCLSFSVFYGGHAHRGVYSSIHVIKKTDRHFQFFVLYLSLIETFSVLHISNSFGLWVEHFVLTVIVVLVKIVDNKLDSVCLSVCLSTLHILL